jgi:hypothetical protein
MTTTVRRQGRPGPGADVFARTVPLQVEKHYFGESKSASLAPVQITGDDGLALGAADQAKTKAFLNMSKKLLNAPELRAVRYRDIAFRDWLKGVATPWRPGLWLVPHQLIDQVDAEAQRWEKERQALVDTAASVYLERVEAMREPLGPMYNPGDYPRVDVFKAKYWVDWKWVSYGPADVLREVRSDIFRRETEKMHRDAVEARTLVQQHLRSQLLAITTHLRGLLAPKASGRRVNLRSDVFERLNEYLDGVAQRDVTGDKDLGAVVKQLRTMCKAMDLETLRDDDAVRDKAAEDMGVITTALSALVEEGPSRGMRMRDEEEEVAS